MARGLASVTLAALVLCTLAAPVISRDGYTPDEEITAVAVAAIRTRALPILPSGILYSRGLPQLYLASLNGFAFGETMTAYRTASLMCAVVAVAFAYLLGSSVAGVPGGLFLSLLMASFPPLVAASVFARPYSALVMVAVVLIWAFVRWVDGRGGIGLPLALVGGAALLHPFGMALAGFPAAFAIADESWRRSSALRFAILALLVGGSVTVILYGLHAVSVKTAGLVVSTGTAFYGNPSLQLPAVYVTSLAKATGWFAATALAAALGYGLRRGGVPVLLVVVVLVSALGFQLGVMFAAVAIWMSLRPRDAFKGVTCLVVAAVGSILWWSSHTAAVTDAQLNWALVSGLTTSAFIYPLDHLRYAFTSFPVMGFLALVGYVRSVLSPDERFSRILRPIAVLTLTFLTVCDVLAVPVNERYLLLPWTLIAIAASISFAGLPTTRGSSVLSEGRLRISIAVVTLLLVSVEHYAYAVERESIVPVSRIEQAVAPPTGPSWDPIALAQLLQPNDIVVCTEELACLYLMNRVDYLFASERSDVAHYVVTRDGALVGFYGGRPVLTNLQALKSIVTHASSGACALIVNLRTGKIDSGLYDSLVNGLAAQFEIRDVFVRDDTSIHRICRAGG